MIITKVILLLRSTITMPYRKGQFSTPRLIVVAHILSTPTHCLPKIYHLLQRLVYSEADSRAK